MLHQKRARIPILLLMVMIAAASWKGWLAYHRSTLDRALIKAVYADDAAATATLLADGADANAKDWSERESHGWLEKVHDLLTGRFYEANPMPVLAIARVMVQENPAITHLLKDHGADPDAVIYWRTTRILPDEAEAITSGIHLLHVFDSPSQSNQSDPVKSWRGQRVALYCGGMPPYMMAERVHIEIEFAPTKTKPSWPIVWSSCIVGTVQSVDVKRKIVHIRLNVQDWHILDTG